MDANVNGRLRSAPTPLFRKRHPHINAKPIAMVIYDIAPAGSGLYDIFSDYLERFCKGKEVPVRIFMNDGDELCFVYDKKLDAYRLLKRPPQLNPWIKEFGKWAEKVPGEHGYNRFQKLYSAWGNADNEKLIDELYRWSQVPS